MSKRGIHTVVLGPFNCCVQGALFVSEHHLGKVEVDGIVSKCQSDTSARSGKCETLLWGIPWAEDDFV